MRAGTLALITPVMTFTLGPLRGDDEVDADGARLLGDAGDALLDVAGGDHHQVVELVDDDDDVRQPLERARLARTRLRLRARRGRTPRCSR